MPISERIILESLTPYQLAGFLEEALENKGHPAAVQQIDKIHRDVARTVMKVTIETL